MMLEAMTLKPRNWNLLKSSEKLKRRQNCVRNPIRRAKISKIDCWHPYDKIRKTYRNGLAVVTIAKEALVDDVSIEYHLKCK